MLVLQLFFSLLAVATASFLGPAARSLTNAGSVGFGKTSALLSLRRRAMATANNDPNTKIRYPVEENFTCQKCFNIVSLLNFAL